MHTIAEKLIYEKLHDRLVTDFNEVPDDKKKEIDIDGAKLSKEFEFILVPTTKYVSGIKTMFMKKPVKSADLIKVERQVWDCDSKQKIHMWRRVRTYTILHYSGYEKQGSLSRHCGC